MRVLRQPLLCAGSSASCALVAGRSRGMLCVLTEWLRADLKQAC